GRRGGCTAGVVVDWRVGWVRPQQQLGQHRALTQGRIEGLRSKRFATNRAVDVGQPDEGELASLGRELRLDRRLRPLRHAGRRLDAPQRDTRAAAGFPASSRVTTCSTLEMVAAKRSIIWASSSSVLT